MRVISQPQKSPISRPAVADENTLMVKRLSRMSSTATTSPAPAPASAPCHHSPLKRRDQRHAQQAGEKHETGAGQTERGGG